MDRLGRTILDVSAVAVAWVVLSILGAEEPAAPGLRVPDVRLAWPGDPVLDLGPVVLPEGHDVAALQVQADRLGADGFVVESRALAEVYAVEWREVVPPSFAGPAAWVPRPEAQLGVDDPGSAVAGLLWWVMRGGDLFPSRLPRSAVVYRAYRRVPHVPPPREGPADLELDPVLAAALDAASDQGRQLFLLHAAVIDGRLPVSTYERVRRWYATHLRSS
jgi:hypothetical protein